MTKTTSVDVVSVIVVVVVVDGGMMVVVGQRLRRDNNIRNGMLGDSDNLSVGRIQSGA